MGAGRPTAEGSGELFDTFEFAIGSTRLDDRDRTTGRGKCPREDCSFIDVHVHEGPRFAISGTRHKQYMYMHK